MRLGPLILGFALFNVLLFVFGIVDLSNPTTSIFIDGGVNWGGFFNSGVLIVAIGMTITGAFGLILKNDKMIFAGMCGYMITYGQMTKPIIDRIGYAPFGHMVYALLMFLNFWIVLEWWRTTDN